MSSKRGSRCYDVGYPTGCQFAVQVRQLDNLFWVYDWRKGIFVLRVDQGANAGRRAQEIARMLNAYFYGDIGDPGDKVAARFCLETRRDGRLAIYERRSNRRVVTIATKWSNGGGDADGRMAFAYRVVYLMNTVYEGP